MSLGDAQLAPDFPGRPRSATAGCYFCGTHKQPEDPGVLDTGHHVHMEGFLYICLPCVEHMANLIGLVDRATAGRLKAKNVELAESNRRLGVELKTARTTLTAQAELVASYRQK